MPRGVSEQENLEIAHSVNILYVLLYFLVPDWKWAQLHIDLASFGHGTKASRIGLYS